MQVDRAFCDKKDWMFLSIQNISIAMNEVGHNIYEVAEVDSDPVEFLFHRGQTLH